MQAMKASAKKTKKPKSRFVRARKEILAIEKHVGPRGLRSLPWHLIYAPQLRDGTASPEIVAAAARSRAEWDAATIPLFSPEIGRAHV